MKIKNVFLPILKMMSVAAIFTVVFLAGCDKEEEQGIAPTVTSSDPSNEATGVSLNSSISATFSATMDASSITGSAFTLHNGNELVPAVTVYNGTAASLTPVLELLPNTLYTATIKGVKDAQGKSIAADYIWTFTTGAAPDNTAPGISVSSPLTDAFGVSTDSKVSITFTEPMDQATITTSTFTLKKGVTAVSGVITYSGNTATFTPSAELEAGTLYTVLITTDATDLAGNALASNHTFNFITVAAPDTTVPEINVTNPLDHATGIVRNTAISATFSEGMDASTVTTSTFSVSDGGSQVAGVVTYSGTTATFTPSTVLDAGTVYTATITNQVLDLAGNALEANTVWSFTTSASATLAVVDLGTAGNYAILAKTAISNIATSAITGHIALSPAATSYITGFPLTNATGYATTPEVTGKVYAADMASPTDVQLTTAVEDMITAYNDAAGRPSPDFLELGTGAVGGLVLTPGLYKWTTTVTLPSDVTISGGANDVWIFQISGDLTMSSAVHITLQDGAQAKNIFWQVAGEAVIGTTAHFEGIILSMTGITFQTGASMDGRALAQTAVTLDGNAVIQPQ